jgi:hypothetical protein
VLDIAELILKWIGFMRLWDPMVRKNHAERKLNLLDTPDSGKIRFMGEDIINRQAAPWIFPAGCVWFFKGRLVFAAVFSTTLLMA